MCVLIAACTHLRGQDASGPSLGFTETVSAQLNASVFVSGETLYYKVNCLGADGKPVSFSKLAYAELVSSDKKSVFRHKFFLTDGSGRGDFFIPPSLASGSYKFIAYTRWMLGSPADGYFQADIAIVNPFAPFKPIPGTPANTALKSDVGSISISVPSQTGTRAKTRLSISVPRSGLNGSYVLSVRKKDALSKLSGEIRANSKNRFEINEGFTLPELRGEIITGTVTAKNGQPAANIDVALSIPGKENALKMARTDATGDFIITVEKPYYSKRAIVQVVGHERSDFSVVLDTDPHPDYSGLEFRRFEITPELEKAVRDRSVASQIENAYYMHRADTLVRTDTRLPFYAGLGKEFVLDQYTRFPTFRETIIEVIADTYFTRNNGSYSLHVREHQSGSDVEEPALVTIDGIYIADPSELFDYPAKNIEKISVIPGTYYLGPKAFNGVMAIETRDGDYAVKASGSFLSASELLRPLQPKRYFAPDYSASSNARIPDYRVQLAWEPDLVLDKPESEFSFFTSDVTGIFEAVLEGFDTNGAAVRATAEFTVK